MVLSGIGDHAVLGYKFAYSILFDINLHNTINSRSLVIYWSRHHFKKIMNEAGCYRSRCNIARRVLCLNYRSFSLIKKKTQNFWTSFVRNNEKTIGLSSY